MASEPFLGFHRSITSPNFTTTTNNPTDTQPPPLASTSSVVVLQLNHHNSTVTNHPKLNRCKTAPAMVVMRDLPPTTTNPKPSSSSLLKQSFTLLIIYLSIGVLIYTFNRDHFSGLETHPVIDGLYFCIVTMCTIGYGDITPVTPSAKLFACFFVLIGFGFIDIMLSGVVNYVLDLQENIMLNNLNSVHYPGLHQTKQKLSYDQQVGRNNKKSHVVGNNKKSISLMEYIYDFGKGRMRIRLKVCLALCVVLLSIGIGTVVLYYVERLDWIDSLYLSVLSVTTVGYGDHAFRTLRGRLFASFWLLFSTLMVARAFLYLAEARIDKRHRRVANWVLERKITVEDLFAADINNSGFLSKSEYIVFKLKEMGKIEERDVLQICNQFNKLDSSNSGKITLRNLLSGQSI